MHHTKSMYYIFKEFKFTHRRTIHSLLIGFASKPLTMCVPFKWNLLVVYLHRLLINVGMHKMHGQSKCARERLDNALLKYSTSQRYCSNKVVCNQVCLYKYYKYNIYTVYQSTGLSGQKYQITTKTQPHFSFMTAW